MKKQFLSLISLIMAATMLLSLFACTNKQGDETSGSTAETVGSEQTEGSSSTEGESTSEPKDTQPEESSSTESDSSDESERETAPETDEDTTPKLEGENAELIELADRLSNTVNAYYTSGIRNGIGVENKNMSLEYAMGADDKQLVTAMKNSRGNTYFENSMDVFVRMKDGKTCFASDGSSAAKANVYRLGYYYYDVHVEGQSFVPAAVPVSEKMLDLKFSSHKHVTAPKVKSDGAYIKVTSYDPYVVFDHEPYSADKYQYLQITMKCDAKTSNNLTVYFVGGDMKTHADESTATFPIIPDGEFHTYNILLSSIRGYNGDISRLRIDFPTVSDVLYVIKEAKLIEADTEGIPTMLNLARYFLTYSDKLHHYAQITAGAKTENIEAVGMLTSIPADTVVSYLVKDKTGIHKDTLEGIDWESAEYAGFDIKDAGVFGYIIPAGKYGGKLEVTLNEGVFSIVQTVVPENNTINPSKVGTNNANDFYFGQRIYTKDNHDLDAFVYEAEIERNPLTKDNFTVDGVTDSAAFAGYDALRGYYKFNVAGTNFGEAYYNMPNKQYKVGFSVKGDDKNRTIYCMTYTVSGGLECAVLLDGKKMVLPVPMEVCKNFNGDGDQTMFLTDDPSFGEVYFPVVVNAGETYSYTVVNLYQNWGKYPLKQVSSIQFTQPYYHLSTGVTETNCIIPWTNIGPGLPDHRAMSAPLWKTQPQHTLGGYHYFIRYTDAEGRYADSESTKNIVVSHGPTYAEVEMNYLTHDGRIKVTYTHMEMPQTDENRTYYTMTYEILDDISFKDFRQDFSFYSVKQNGTGSYYRKVGFLDANNQSKIVDANTTTKAQTYELGNDHPYFDFFEVQGCTNENGYVNLSFLVASSSFIIGGEKSDAPFLLTDCDKHLYLSLDLGEVTLKKGDRFEIKAILMPWGSQESVYDGSNGKAPDQNVRDVRENSILDPFKVTPVDKCEVIDTAYLPSLRSTNGASAEFTVSGGENNVAIRIYGFKKLTVPTIMEKIDGKWVELDLSSSEPDKKGYSNQYDGYMVHYDGDGTFSYSFVTDLTGDQTRTFKIVANKDFAGWPALEDQPEDNAPIDTYVGAGKISEIIIGKKGVGDSKLMKENGLSFVRIYGNNKDGEGYFVPVVLDKKVETGKYIVVKYRIPTTNSADLRNFEFFTSTQNAGPSAEDYFVYNSIKNDGQWHVIIIEADKMGVGSYNAADDGKFYTKYLRLDFFNQKVPEKDCIDIAYICLAKTLEELIEMNSDMKSVTLVASPSQNTYIDTATGNEIENEILEGGGEIKPDETTKPEVETTEPEEDTWEVEEWPNNVHPESEYKDAKVPFAFCLDMLNGAGYEGEPRFSAEGGSTTRGLCILDYNVSTVNGGQLIFSGWTVAEGGISKYVFSVDGGKTWADCSYKGFTEAGTVNQDYLDSASIRLNGYNFKDPEASMKGAGFQGTVGSGANAAGVVADLSSHVGQKIDLMLAAIPVNEPDALCVLALIKGVNVVAEE